MRVQRPEGTVYKTGSQQDGGQLHERPHKEATTSPLGLPGPVCAEVTVKFSRLTGTQEYHRILCERCPGELNIKLMCALIVLIHFWAHKIRKLKHNIQVLFVTCVIYDFKTNPN